MVSRDEWLVARKQLLAEEKAVTRQRDEIAARRRQLPWVRIDQRYLFEGPRGPVTLSDLFAGRSQLFVYHFMFHPSWDEGCKRCSLCADHLDRSAPHLASRDVTVVAVSRAPLAKIAPFQKRMGWRFDWVSSAGTRFNQDFRVSFSPEEIASGKVDYNYTEGAPLGEERHGVSVFHKNAAGEIFHTYSSYGRGLEDLLGVYTPLDMTPKGRDEAGLPWPMAWVRHHDAYDADRPVALRR
jgi:predicted dithiol-disulfide oxidoreductase (DUF899 family)